MSFQTEAASVNVMLAASFNLQNNRMEYLKLFWKHNYPNDPVVIIYEVDTEDERYAIRLIDVFADGHTSNQEDKPLGYVTEAPVETVQEINAGDIGEELNPA